MKKLRPIFLFAIIIVLAYFLYLQSLESNPIGRDRPSVILTTFGNKDENGQWTGEVSPYMKQIKYPNDISEMLPMCESAYKGKIFDSPVIVIVTGSGKVAISGCILDVLQKTSGNIKEVILTGTAGISPMQGGMLTNNHLLKNGSPVMIGDVCINSTAGNFSSQYYTSDLANTSEVNPIFWPSDSIEKTKLNSRGMDLAKELYSASKHVNWPEATESIIEIDIKYHGHFRPVKAWSPVECMEVTDDLFWHDINADQVARNLAFTLLKNRVDKNIIFEDVLITTAMESQATEQIIARWNEANNTKIPFAYVRGASNYDHTWIKSNGLAAVSGKTSIEQRENENGVSFSSNTAAQPVLKMFELRNN